MDNFFQGLSRPCGHPAYLAGREMVQVRRTIIFSTIQMR